MILALLPVGAGVCEPEGVGVLFIVVLKEVIQVATCLQHAVLGGCKAVIINLKQHPFNKGRWRSWLSHLSNTQKVLSSNLGRLIVLRYTTAVFCSQATDWASAANLIAQLGTIT